MQSPSETVPKPSALSTSYLDYCPTASDLHQRRLYPRKASIDNGSSNVSQVAKAIESGEPLDIEQVGVSSELFMNSYSLSSIHYLALKLYNCQLFANKSIRSMFSSELSNGKSML